MPEDIMASVQDTPEFKAEFLRISLAERLLKLCPKDKSLETICNEAGIAPGKAKKFLSSRVDFTLDELVKIALLLNRSIDITFPAKNPRPLPPHYETIAGVIVEFNRRYWHVSMNSLIMVGYTGRSQSMDRLFRFEEVHSGEVLWITGHAYDQMEAVGERNRAKASKSK